MCSKAHVHLDHACMMAQAYIPQEQTLADGAEDSSTNANKLLCTSCLDGGTLEL
jgi:hypothetical protein